MAGTYTKLFYHLVFSTKNRQRFIAPSIESELHKYTAGVVRGCGGICVEISGMADHVHILAVLPPKIAVSDALRDIKSNTSRWVHKTWPLRAAFAWQDGFAAFSVSTSQVEPVRQYIRDQKAHHAGGGYQEELLTMLRLNEVEFDPRYLWD